MGGVLPFLGQLDVYVVNWDALLELAVFDFAEEEGASFIVGDVVEEGLLPPQIGNVLEVDEQLIGLIAQL